MKKKILAVLCAALIICLSIVSAYAVVPPVNVNGETVYNGGKPSSVDVPHIISIMNCMVDLNYFQFGHFVLVGKPDGSSSTRVYCYNGSDIVKDDSTISWGTGAITTAYYFTTQGFQPYTATYTGHTFNITDVVCYIENGRVVENPSFVPGSLSSSTISSLSSQWLSFYNKVFYYDENIQSSYDQGVADGGAEQYREGYDDGYSDGDSDGYNRGYAAGQNVGRAEGFQIGIAQGRDEGYETGYDEGYAAGQNVGRAEGFQIGIAQGREEGYETGYDEGYADGDSDGYDRGYAGGLITGREEGYDTGYADGLEDGYETGYADGLEAGGGSSDLIPFELSFYLSVPISQDVENGDPIVFFKDYLLTWKNDDLETLGFRDPEDEDEGQLAGFYAYHVLAYFSPQQVSNPSSVNFSIPSEIVSLVPNAEFASITFDPYEVIDGDRVANVYLVYDQYYLGYNKGFQDGGNILDALGTVAAAPVTGLAQALDFDLFGVNVRVIVIGVIAVLLAFVAWKLIKRFIPV